MTVKYSENGVQYHLGIREGDVGRYVILPGDPKRCVKIAAHLNAAEPVADFREFTSYTGCLEGERVSVVSTGIGAPSAAIAIEELVRCGADTFIRVGTCGGMQPEIESGDLIVATAAARLGGSSLEYAPAEYPAVADHGVVAALETAAADLKYPHHVGVVQSKDSFYGQHEPEKMPLSRELIRKWETYRRLGCLASEMETAALMIAGAYLKVRVGAVLLVMANQEREKLGLYNPVVHDTEAAVCTAIEAIRRLIRDGG